MIVNEMYIHYFLNERLTCNNGNIWYYLQMYFENVTLVDVIAQSLP